MISDVGMSEKKEEKKMTVACPLCLKRGIQSRVRLFQINYSEAVVSCENAQCPFPLLGGHITSNIVRRRDFRNMKDEVPAKDPVSSKSEDAPKSSSQSKPATVCGEAESKNPHPNVSATSGTTAVINAPASDPKLVDGQFAKFEFTTPIPVQSKPKKKTKKKYYTGGRKKKPNKKPIPPTQNTNVETKS